MDILLWGGTGQAKVVRPIVEGDGHRVVAVFDRSPSVPPPFTDVPLIHDEQKLELLHERYSGGQWGYAVTIGGTSGRERVEVGERLRGRHMLPVAVRHRASWVAESAAIGEGGQILAMAAVSEQTVLGRYCIVNTNATIDHECRLGDGVHVMPGAVIAGSVQVGDHASVGSNATVLPRIRIGRGAVIGAGAVVTKDVPADAVVVGVPAKQVGGAPRLMP